MSQPPGPVGPPTLLPTEWHLHGRGISVSFFPGGFGPVRQGKGLLRFTYQDAHRSLSFFDDEVRTVEVPDLGSVVSVTIVPTVDVGSTTFSLLVPRVFFQAPNPTSAFVQTEGVTTVHRAFVALIGHAQVESYTITRLTGTASRGAVPL